MDATTAPSIETRLPLLAAAIGAHIPGAQVRLFGSRARGNASPDSDIDLLITVPDIWLASHDRWLTLSELRRRLAMVDVSLDLLLFSETEVAGRPPPWATCASWDVGWVQVIGAGPPMGGTTMDHDPPSSWPRDLASKLSALLEWMPLRLDPDSGAILFRHPTLLCIAIQDPSGMARLLAEPVKGKLPIGV